MSATKNWLHNCSDSLDAALDAIDDAIMAVDRANDLIYGPNDEPMIRIPRSMAAELRCKQNELRLAVAALECAQESSKLPPILPGERREVMLP
jgi:hypothetical protein